ncbi:unnamed protein product [Brachionus calyciflorus]|uniref:lysoplasmalogenase n=1 Tax=Brachionus calyciflorus TaxID=104777 RepID=A0A813QCF2_9BILA|nr:unnamed protein product [Brachionus calyciflorus]
MVSRIAVIKHVGPKLVPFFESVFIFFVLYPLKSESNLFFLIIKCMPMIALLIFVLSNGFNLNFEYSYSRRIFTGLVFSMIGDACLVYPEEFFIFGVISFGIAHIIYLTAFGLKPLNHKFAVALFILALPISALYIPFLSNYVLKVIVPVYMGLLLSMLWRAVSRLQIFNKDVEWTWTRLCCSIGAFFFVISDSVLSFDFFIYPIPYSHPTIMFTYYASQLGIALSVVDSDVDHEGNHLVIQHNDLINGVSRIYNYLKSIYFEDNIEVLSDLNESLSSVKKNE